MITFLITYKVVGGGDDILVTSVKADSVSEAASRLNKQFYEILSVKKKED